MTIDGETFDPFSAETLKVLPAVHESYRKEIIDRSREKYALALKEVKEKLEDEKRIKIEEPAKKEDEKEDEDKEPEPLV